jgi:predicted O-methyltransferase YrrM
VRDEQHKAELDFKTEDWFHHHIRLWKDLYRDLAGRPNLRFLEIGTWEGRSACWILENVLTHPTATLTCVDPFIVTPEHRSLDLPVNFDYEAQFDRNIRALGRDDQVQKLPFSSRIALPNLEVESFDSIYVDGSHRATDTLTDIVLAWPLLRPGGLMIVDDYAMPLLTDWERPAGYGHPREAVDAFLELFADEVNVLHHDFQLVVDKKRRGLRAGEQTPWERVSTLDWTYRSRLIASIGKELSRRPGVRVLSLCAESGRVPEIVEVAIARGAAALQVVDCDEHAILTEPAARNSGPPPTGLTVVRGSDFMRMQPSSFDLVHIGSAGSPLALLERLLLSWGLLRRGGILFVERYDVLRVERVTHQRRRVLDIFMHIFKADYRILHLQDDLILIKVDRQPGAGSR